MIDRLKLKAQKIIKGNLDDKQDLTPEQMKAEIDKTDVISFDIFDTLLKRDVPVPTDVFYIVQKLAQKRSLASTIALENFHDRRIAAEIEARKTKIECNLEEIYRAYTGLTKAEQQALASLECEVEINVAEANPKLLDVYNFALQHHTVILTSDMYLDTATVKAMLDKSGITGYEHLYISNEMQKNKAVGTLYQCVSDVYPGKTILHIGNSYRADYENAIAAGWKAVKIRTNTYCLSRKFRYHSVKKDNLKHAAALDAFLNNHVSTAGAEDEGRSYYKLFGYERFGPLLYGFVTWCFHEMKKNGVESAFFVARDGYILKLAYDELGYNHTIPSYYFEASRRSFRVPAYNEDMTLEDLMFLSPLLPVSNIEQVFDSFGLDVEQYEDLIDKHGYTKDFRIVKDKLLTDTQFKGLFDDIKEDVFKNAKAETSTLCSYLAQFDFSKKVALVDIGWSGSIQRNLHTLLERYKVSHHIEGYYIGLNEQSKDLLKPLDLHAHGYLFDGLNRNDFDIELPFRPLLETFFLEQDGSIKKYSTAADGAVQPVRYTYEYRRGTEFAPEAKAVKVLQSGARQFCKDFQKSYSRVLVGNKADVMFRYIFETGAYPDKQDVEQFGDFDFYNNGFCIKLAAPQSKSYYVSHSAAFKTDFKDAQWRTGFVKRLTGSNFAYQTLYTGMRELKRSVKSKLKPSKT
jgi:predicted HAD superfamily hydrolase